MLVRLALVQAEVLCAKRFMNLLHLRQACASASSAEATDDHFKNLHDGSPTIPLGKDS